MGSPMPHAFAPCFARAMPLSPIQLPCLHMNASNECTKVDTRAVKVQLEQLENRGQGTLEPSLSPLFPCHAKTLCPNSCHANYLTRKYLHIFLKKNAPLLAQNKEMYYHCAWETPKMTEKSSNYLQINNLTKTHHAHINQQEAPIKSKQSSSQANKL